MTGDLLLEPREVPLGGVRGLTVHRTLPHRDLPTVGAWCFVDHFGPTREPMTVLPHPHTGLQTVTWPLAGDIRHRDNLGSDVVLKPGELNLMTSGDGVSHSEFSVGDDAMMHGLQLWVALPDASRAGPAAFEHLPDLPRTGGNGWRAIVLVGQLADAESPATTYSPLVGAELTLGAAATATVPLAAGVRARGPGGRRARARRRLRPHPPADALPRARARSSVDLVAARDATVLLIGGEPFTESLVMWWNFIGRSHDDIAQGPRRLGAGHRTVRSASTVTTASSSRRRRCRVSGSRRVVVGPETRHHTAGAWTPRSGTVGFGYCRYLKSERTVMTHFTDKVAVVTGAGSGIGRALAVELARRGAKLAISDVDDQGLAETLELVKQQGADVRSDHLDVAERELVLAYATPSPSTSAGSTWSSTTPASPTPAASRRCRSRTSRRSWTSTSGASSTAPRRSCRT